MKNRMPSAVNLIDDEYQCERRITLDPTRRRCIIAAKVEKHAAVLVFR
jgi:hypothetical protein